MSLLLSDEERNKFATWLERNADSCRLMIGQMEKSSYAAAIVPSMKQECAASLIIAKKLRETEGFSIGKTEPGENP